MGLRLGLPYPFSVQSCHPRENYVPPQSSDRLRHTVPYPLSAVGNRGLPWLGTAADARIEKVRGRREELCGLRCLNHSLCTFPPKSGQASSHVRTPAHPPAFNRFRSCTPSVAFPHLRPCMHKCRPHMTQQPPLYLCTTERCCVPVAMLPCGVPCAAFQPSSTNLPVTCHSKSVHHKRCHGRHHQLVGTGTGRQGGRALWGPLLHGAPAVSSYTALPRHLVALFFYPAPQLGTQAS